VFWGAARANTDDAVVPSLSCHNLPPPRHVLQFLSIYLPYCCSPAVAVTAGRLHCGRATERHTKAHTQLVPSSLIRRLATRKYVLGDEADDEADEDGKMKADGGAGGAGGSSGRVEVSTQWTS
jgi:hypothetical protein